MATILASGEQVAVIAELGAPIDVFTLNSATDGILDTDRLDGIAEDDISEFVTAINIVRGRSSQLDGFGAGRCTIELVDTQRRFDPTNQASPYWDAPASRTSIVPRRSVQVLLNNAAVFTGRLADIDIEYDKHSVSVVTMTCVDDFVLLASAYIGAAFTPTEQLSGARVEAVLDRTEVDYPLSRDIDAGTQTLGAYEVAASTNALAYLQQCAEAERGLLFINMGGDLRFTNRADYLFMPAVISVFADDGSGLPYQSLSVIYGQEFLYNRVQVTRENGVLQTAESAASQSEFGVSTYALDDTLHASDAAALSLAQSLLDSYSEPVYRFDQMELNYVGYNNSERSEVNALEIGTPIQIVKTYATGVPASVTEIYTVERISHSISANQHVVQFGLRFANIVYQFVLNDATYGVLDADNALS